MDQVGDVRAWAASLDRMLTEHFRSGISTGALTRGEAIEVLGRICVLIDQGLPGLPADTVVSPRRALHDAPSAVATAQN